MADHTGIEWTDATWNPLRGCSRVSDGCRNCYAEKVAARFSGPGMPYEGLLHPTTKAWNGSVRLLPEKLVEPLTWKQPRRIFVNSMSDLFHDSVPDSYIAAVFGIMAAAPQHIFQVLTKRPERAAVWFGGLMQRSPRAVMHECVKGAIGYHHPRRPAINDGPWPLPNVWLGVSVEDQETADERIPLLMSAPATVRWLSCEPLLGPIDLSAVPPPHGCRPINGATYDELRGCLPKWQEHPVRSKLSNGVDWVVAGGESGPAARPMHPDWARALRDQCASASVPFFFKQRGEWGQYVNEDHYTHCGAERQPHAWIDRDTAEHGHCWLVDDDGGWSNYSGEPPMREDGHILDRVAVVGRFGKRAAGRLLDGVEHNAYPEAL